MKSPIIIYEPGDATIFESVEEAQAYMEWPDVKDELYTGYDSEGRLLNLKVVKTPVKILFFTLHNHEIVIEDCEPEQKRPDELIGILSKHLSFPKFGISSEWLANATLTELVAKALEIEKP